MSNCSMFFPHHNHILIQHRIILHADNVRGAVFCGHALVGYVADERIYVGESILFKKRNDGGIRRERYAFYFAILPTT